jgi:hypothetical protein
MYSQIIIDSQIQSAVTTKSSAPVIFSMKAQPPESASLVGSEYDFVLEFGHHPSFSHQESVTVEEWLGHRLFACARDRQIIARN